MRSGVLPRVSIGMPVYNGEAFVAEAIESILNQSFGDFELIVSDNASSDNTADICRVYAARDARIRFLRNDDNLGAAENYNQVFALSRGEYFKWAAHDDVCAPSLLEKCVRILDDEPSVVACYSGVKKIDEDGQCIGEQHSVAPTDSHEPYQRFRSLIRRDSMCEAICGVIRSSTLKKTSLIGKYSDSDRVLLGELSLHGRLHEIRESLFFRRFHAGTSTNRYPGRQTRTQWFDPRATGHVFPFWRQFLEYLRAIHRSPIGRGERMRCYGAMCRWVLAHHRPLRQDVTSCMSRLLPERVKAFVRSNSWYRGLVDRPKRRDLIRNK